MASRSLGELLLRPTPFTRISHTTCPHSIRWISQTRRQSAQPQRKEEDDPFTLRAQQPRETVAQRNQPLRQPSPQPSQAETSRAIDSLFSDLPRDQSGPPPMSSSNELRAARSNHIFGSEFSSPGRGRGSRGPPKLNFDSMDLPDTLLNPTLANKPSSASSLATQQEETFANYPRLNPTYGRTVELDPSRGRDIVRGISMMGSLMARNKVKSDFNKQRFHERGGLKRKRLNSERWRARFKVGFREVTGRVTELTKKGW